MGFDVTWQYATYHRCKHDEAAYVQGGYEASVNLGLEVGTVTGSVGTH